MVIWFIYQLSVVGWAKARGTLPKAAIARSRRRAHAWIRCLAQDRKRVGTARTE
jgi:hypothetical protein